MRVNKVCVHAIGIGSTGAGYVDALIRTGELEDVLIEDGSAQASIVIDTEKDNLIQVKDYASGLNERLTERGISDDRFSFSSVVLNNEVYTNAGKISKSNINKRLGLKI